MLPFIILIVNIIINNVYGKLCSTSEFEREFTSSDYCVHKLPESKVDILENALYEQDKCKTCCRVVIASEFNYEQNRAFEQGDKETPYVLDMEFDDPSGIRLADGNYEQNILLRPLKESNELQMWEFAPYKMFISYHFPKRVHDIRGGANVGSTLIIWKKKEPLAKTTDNQRFVYIHPYPEKYYSKEDKKYYKHFYLPFHDSEDLCYEAQPKNQPRTSTKWIGMKNLKVEGPSYQIAARICDYENPRQKFVPIYV